MKTMRVVVRPVAGGRCSTGLDFVKATVGGVSMSSRIISMNIRVLPNCRITADVQFINPIERKSFFVDFVSE